MTLPRDERSEEGLGKQELKDLDCRGTRKGFPEEALTWALKDELEFVRREEGKIFFSREGVTKKWPVGKANCPNSCRFTTEQPLSSLSPPLPHIT